MEAAWFGGRLRELRGKAGLTQGQLAERAKLHRVEVAKLETGTRSPSWETVLSICTALGVSCEEFRQEAAPTQAKGPGRPRKAVAEASGQDADAPAPDAAEPTPEAGKPKRPRKRKPG